MPKKTTLAEFIEKARKVHGDKYDYSQMEYKDNHTKACIVCPKHGKFWQTPNNHLRGKGCSECARETLYDKSRRMTTEKFIEKAREVHGDAYVYDEVDYINNHTDVCIICPTHGRFWQSPKSHLRGAGCPKCPKPKAREKQIIETNNFIQKARKIHGDEYIYDKVVYVSAKMPVTITCKIHGDFQQTPDAHLAGKGCITCSGTKKMSTEEFIEKAKSVHDNNYIYTKTNYVNNRTPVVITCPKHGDFEQSPGHHLRGCGCPHCVHHVSKDEMEIYNLIASLIDDENIIKNDRDLLDGREIDILIPSHKLAIEYNGLYWHSENQGKDKNYHLRKTELAESKGYHLIQIFEDEWLEHKDIIANKIRHFLGKDGDKPVIGGRKCLIKIVSKTDAQAFLNTHHIQGFVGSTVYYGAFYSDRLVGVMTFKQEKSNEWNLTRFSTDVSYRLPGLANKIFKQFLKDFNPAEVKTFLDRRWSHGDVNVYDKMGFVLEETLSPDYRYIVGNQRLHKFGFRKQILHKKYGMPLAMTEKEMTSQLGFYRIWDCGLYKYTWKP